MKVDILLATYNSEKYINEQIDSLFGQTFKDFRLLIRDGGSTDSTLSIIKELENRFPEKVCIVPSSGRSDFLENFQMLMRSSDADYTFFCDHDDIWLPEKVEKSLNRICSMTEKYGSGIPLCVHCDLMMVDGSGRTVNNSVHRAWSMGYTPERSGYPVDIPCFGCTLVINRTLRDMAMSMTSGWSYHDTWCGRIAWYLGKVGYIDEALIKYRVHGSNVSCGAPRRYPAVLFYHLRNFTDARKKLRKNLIGASAAFAGRFQELPPLHRLRLEIFGNWQKYNIFVRLYMMLRYKIYANGIFRTVGLLFL